MTRESVAIIGGGISGMAYAHVLKKNGFDPVIFERNPRVGGVWALTYAEVRLQNLDFQYHLSDVPWKGGQLPHPTRDQIRGYWDGAVADRELDVRLGHEVKSCVRDGDGWKVTVIHDGQEQQLPFHRLVVAIGQFSQRQHRPPFEGEAHFKGEVLVERQIEDMRGFDGKKVVVVGFGKSALDVANQASMNGGEVHHVFRTPRWVLPLRIAGLHYTWLVMNRFGTIMMPSWGQPTGVERFLHTRLAGGVRMFWKGLSRVVRTHFLTTAARSGAERDRLRKVLPDHDLLPDLRSAVALEPTGYFPRVARGEITPHHAELSHFDAHGVHLSDGTHIATDAVVLALGAEAPRFPFLPEEMRTVLEREDDGVQLYRHLVHPDFPDVAFAGFNHGFLHVPAAEVGAQWMACLWKGELQLPPAQEMHHSIDRILAWKREHITFEPSRSCGVNTRFQQHLDILLQDLQVSPYRKLPNPVAEVFGRYGAGDYACVVEEVLTRPSRSLTPVPIDA